MRRKLDHGIRIDNLVRHPEFVEYLDRNGVGAPPRIHMPKHGDRWFAFNLVTTSDWGLQLLIVRDVTTEARLENMRRDFVANASHELRSPLTVIGGYLDSLADDPTLDAGWREPVHEMRRQSDRMRNIVQDLLELSRLEASAGEADREPVDVGGMLALIRKEVLSRPERPAEVNLAIDSDALLLGMENELHSVFQNLVSNAVKYTPRGRAHRHPLLDGRLGRPRLGRGHRHRHPGQPHSAPDRALLPGRRRPLAQDGRLRARPGDRQARVTAPRRPSSTSRARRARAACSPAISRRIAWSPAAAA